MKGITRKKEREKKILPVMNTDENRTKVKRRSISVHFQDFGTNTILLFPPSFSLEHKNQQLLQQ